MLFCWITKKPGFYIFAFYQKKLGSFISQPSEDTCYLNDNSKTKNVCWNLWRTTKNSLYDMISPIIGFKKIIYDRKEYQGKVRCIEFSDVWWRDYLCGS